jgi:LPS sulfotransferase NodH
MSALSVLRPSDSHRDALARAMLDLRSIAGGTNYRRFLIVGTARTGSTMLTSLLNAHSQALAFGELFRSQDAIGWDMAPFLSCQGPRLLALYRSDPVAFLHGNVFRRWPRNYGAVGFKLFYYHARTGTHAVLWDHLAANVDISILHIKRRNMLEQYYSLQLAHKTQVWSIQRPLGEMPPPIRLEVETCREHFAWVRMGEQECETFFKGHAVKDIYYEDLVASQDQEMDDIQKFLGLRPERVSPRTARQRTGSLSELIANYEELRHAFADTPWAHFFQEHTG